MAQTFRDLVGDVAEHEAALVLRKRLGLTQHQVSIATGIPSYIVSRFEAGWGSLQIRNMLLAYYARVMEGQAAPAPVGNGEAAAMDMNGHTSTGGRFSAAGPSAVRNG